MQSRKLTDLTSFKHLALVTAILLSATAFGGELAPTIDTFDNAANNSLGYQRQLITDTVAGGSSTATQTLANGVVTLKGEIVPARGQLGWVSYVVPLDAQGGAQDASAFEGVLLRVKLNKGNLSVSVNSTEVTNFDYHAAPIAVIQDGEFHTLKVPFNSLKRAWSEQTVLNPETVNGISIVAYAVQQDSFDFALDSISFY